MTPTLLSNVTLAGAFSNATLAAQKSDKMQKACDRQDVVRTARPSLIQRLMGTFCQPVSRSA
ncbi:hypothetical protein [Roseovarius sp. 2305UL8-3]|uniref:hypothetical protein n=1 Tax=Roseovarius conchicola TaxID=3121636 RepID=UPI003528B0FC